MATRLYLRHSSYSTANNDMPAGGWNHLNSTTGGAGLVNGAGLNGVLGYDLAYNPTSGRYLIVGDQGSANYETYMAYADSVDGPWTYIYDLNVYKNTAAGGGINACIYVPSSGLFVIASDEGNIWTSPTAEAGTWTLRYSNGASLFVNKITIANGNVVVSCPQSTIIYSTDGGLTWTTANVGFTGTATACREVIWDGSKYIAVGQSGQVGYTTNIAGTWTQTTVGITNSDCWSIAYSPTLGRYCVGMGNGTVRTATSVLAGSTWTAATGTFGGSVDMVRWGNGRFVASGDGRTIAYSTNGTAFTVTQYNTSTTKADVWGVYNFSGGNTWLAVTEYYPSLVWESNDNGTTWQATGYEQSVTQTNVGLASASRNAVATQQASDLKVLSTSPGSLMQAAAFTTIATTTTQTALLYIGATQPLASNQTVGGGSIILNAADSETNTNTNFWTNSLNVYVWRPSTKSVVGYVRDATGASLGGTEPTAAGSIQVTNITGITSSAVSAQAGDIVVVEVWARITQGMGTAYGGSFYYDGSTVNTTENAVVTNHASFIEFTENLTFTTPTISGGRSEAVAAAESILAFISSDRASSELLSAIEFATEDISVDRDITESVTALDDATEDRVHNATASETVTGSESVQSQLDAIADINEFLADLYDDLGGSLAAENYVLEIGDAMDEMSSGLAQQASASETSTASESQDRTFLSSSSASESVTADTTQTNVKTSVGIQIESTTEGSLVNWCVPTVYSSPSSLVSTASRGSSFQCTQSGILNTVSFRGFVTGADPGSGVTIYVYEQNTATTASTSATLVGTVTIPFAQLPTSLDTITADFSSLSIALTPGKWYATYYGISGWGGTSLNYRFISGSAATTNGVAAIAIGIFGTYNSGLGSSGNINAYTSNFQLFSVTTVANTTDTPLGAFTAASDITETSASSDAQDNLVSASADAEEDSPVSDTQDFAYVAGGVASESVTASESIAVARNALALDLEGSGIVHIDGASGTSQNASSNAFLGFIYTPTTDIPLATISLSLRQFNTGATTPTQPCTVELWQGVVGATPQTLLKSVPYFIENISTSVSGTRYEFDFSDITLQAGQTYMIGHRVGSDVTSLTKYPLVLCAGNQLGTTNYLESLYPVIRRDVFNGSYAFLNNSGRLPNFRVNTTGVQGSALGGFTSASVITEPSVAAENQDSVSFQNNFQDETLSIADNTSGIYSPSVDRTESVTNQDLNSGSLIADKDVTESVSASDEDVASLLAIASRSETSTIVDSLISYASFESIASESGSTSDVQSGIFTADKFITESGSGLDAQSNTASRNADRSETSSALDSGAQQLSTNAVSTEAGSAQESNDSTRIRIASVSEVVNLLDTSLSSALFSSAISELLTAVDSIQAVASLYTRSAINGDDIIGIVINASGDYWYPVISDAVASVDTQIGIYSPSASASETGSGADSLVGSVPRSAVISEAGVAADLSTKVIITYHVIAELLSALDSGTSQLDAVKSITESVTVTHSQLNVFVAVVSRTEPATASDAPSGQSGRLASRLEALLASDSAFNVMITNQLISEPALALDGAVWSRTINAAGQSFVTANISGLLLETPTIDINDLYAGQTDSDVSVGEILADVEVDAAETVADESGVRADVVVSHIYATSQSQEITVDVEVFYPATDSVPGYISIARNV